MLANYGYKDGSGDFFITVDTDLCTGCGDCIEACPSDVLELVENEYDIDAEEPLMAVAAAHRSRIKYSCASCKPAAGHDPTALPCVAACEPDAIRHSW